MSELEKAVKIKVDNMLKAINRRLFEDNPGVNVVQRGNPLEHFTIDQWLKVGGIIDEYHIEKYPNAKKAAELKKTKLYKALK